MNLSEHIAIKRQMAESVCHQLTEEINKLGFATAEIQNYPNYDDATFVLIKDPLTGENNLTCYWYDKRKNQRLGSLQFNSDDTFYAEFDVVKPHPTKTKFFVVAVNAWGNPEKIKSEAKLLPMPE